MTAAPSEPADPGRAAEAGPTPRAGRALGSLGCLALGAFAAWEGYRLGLFAFGAAEAGLFPFLFGLLLATAALVSLARDLFGPASPAESNDREGGGRALAYLGILGLYALALGPLGFLPATWLALLALMAGVERMPPLRAGIIAALAAGCSWLLFVGLLSVPLPAGALTPPWLGP